MVEGTNRQGSTEESAYSRLFREDPNFRVVTVVAKGNGWSEEQIVQEYLLDLQAEDDDEMSPEYERAIASEGGQGG